MNDSSNIQLQLGKYNLVRKYYLDRTLDDGRPFIEWNEPDIDLSGFNYSDIEKRYFKACEFNIDDSHIEFENEPFCGSFEWIKFNGLGPEYILVHSRIRTKLALSAQCLVEMYKYIHFNPKLFLLTKLKTSWNFQIKLLKLNSDYTEYDTVIDYDKVFYNFGSAKREKEIVEHWLLNVIQEAPGGVDFLFKQIISQRYVYQHIKDLEEKRIYFENQTGLSQIRKKYIYYDENNLEKNR